MQGFEGYFEGWKQLGSLCDLMDAVERKYEMFNDRGIYSYRACSGLFACNAVDIYGLAMVRDVLRSIGVGLPLHQDSIYWEYGDREREVAALKPVSRRSWEILCPAPERFRMAYHSRFIRDKIEGEDWALWRMTYDAKIIGCDEIECEDIKSWLEKLLATNDPYVFEEYLWISGMGLNAEWRKHCLSQNYRMAPVKQLITGNCNEIRQISMFAIAAMKRFKADMNEYRENEQRRESA